MIRFHAVSNDLAIIYPKHSFNDKQELISILKNCFSFKFKEFLISCEKEKDLLKKQDLITKYLNDNAYFPLKDYALSFDSIIGLKNNFINDNKEFIFNSIPNSLKKEKKKSFSCYSDKRIEFMNNFLFYNYLTKNAFNYDRNMLFLLECFHLSLDDIPLNLQYIIKVTSSEKSAPFCYQYDNQANSEFFNVKNMFYLLLMELCRKEVGHLFIGRWFGFSFLKRGNVDTRFYLSSKKDIKTELISRALEPSFNNDTQQVKENILKTLYAPKLYEDMLNLLKFLKSTLKHLD